MIPDSSDNLWFFKAKEGSLCTVNLNISMNELTVEAKE